jgi:hypothetical protein
VLAPLGGLPKATPYGGGWLLLAILAIAIRAVLCGAEDWPDLEEFGRRRADWLRGFLQLSGGIPSHDTFRRVFGDVMRSGSDSIEDWPIHTRPCRS